MEEKQLDKICAFVLELNKGSPLDGDEIEQINIALKRFNGDE